MAPLPNEFVGKFASFPRGYVGRSEANFVGPLDRLTGAIDEMRIARDRYGQTVVEILDGWRLVPEWVTY